MWVAMIQHKTLDQYLTSGKVSTRFIQGFKRYRLTKNFNILCNADADVDADAAVVYFRTGELKINLSDLVLEILSLWLWFRVKPSKHEHKRLVPDLAFAGLLCGPLCINTLKKASDTHQMNAFIRDFDWFLVCWSRKHSRFGSTVNPE